MYRILCDSYVLYDPRLPDLFLTDPALKQKKNEPGELTFTTPKEHPFYGSVEKLKSRVRVYLDDTLIWLGRVIEDELDLYENHRITAEGALAFLLDSVIHPFEFDGSPGDLFAQVLTAHNAQVNEDQRFLLGEASVGGTIHRSSEDYLSAWQVVSSRLLEELGDILSCGSTKTRIPCWITSRIRRIRLPSGSSSAITCVTSCSITARRRHTPPACRSARSCARSTRRATATPGSRSRASTMGSTILWMSRWPPSTV